MARVVIWRALLTGQLVAFGRPGDETPQSAIDDKGWRYSLGSLAFKLCKELRLQAGSL